MEAWTYHNHNKDKLSAQIKLNFWQQSLITINDENLMDDEKSEIEKFFEDDLKDIKFADLLKNGKE